MSMNLQKGQTNTFQLKTRLLFLCNVKTDNPNRGDNLNGSAGLGSYGTDKTHFSLLCLCDINTDTSKRVDNLYGNGSVDQKRAVVL